LDKFRDKDGNWRENMQRVEEDIPNVALSYIVQEDDRERSKVKFESEQERIEGNVAKKGIMIVIYIIIIIIIIII
jgi:hypothetical protein